MLRPWTKLWRTIKEIDGRAKGIERNYYFQWNLVLIVQAVSRQVQPIVQHFKAGQTHFFKRTQTSNMEAQEETSGDGTDIHLGPSNDNNQEL